MISVAFQPLVVSSKGSSMHRPFHPGGAAAVMIAVLLAIGCLAVSSDAATRSSHHRSAVRTNRPHTHAHAATRSVASRGTSRPTTRTTAAGETAPLAPPTGAGSSAAAGMRLASRPGPHLPAAPYP